MFRKLLVANRGEIALRVIRTAHALGIRTVAVFSEADARSPHVSAADEAYPIGPAEAASSYLSVEAVLAAARASGADAIHPGYGFLSERSEFARAVSEAGIVFVGPPAEVIATVGDKVAARRLAARAGVPVIPGIDKATKEAVRKFVKERGLPIVVKAAAGGGGRGMRLVAGAGELEEALQAAQREAEAAFGDGRLFVEKYLRRPRHIEVQVLCDRFGAAAAVGERECSIQRRHQKIVEESPSPAVTPAMRRQMTEAALKIAKAAKYLNAGTIEFLLDGHDFYFLEVNARLQVEHPVTELRFNCDLVAEQLKLAAGEPVLKPATPRGHAIECRIYAEDARHAFRPAGGDVLYFNQPGGPGVRFDTFLSPGIEIGSYYDGLLGKLICHGQDREQARERMLGALGEFCLAGVIHTAGFLRDIVASEQFKRGELSTGFIEDHFAGWDCAPQETRAALIATLLAARRRASSAPSAMGTSVARQRRSPWEGLGDFALWSRR